MTDTLETKLVVGLAPFPVYLSNGSHLSPGDLAPVEIDSFNQGLIDQGRIGVVDIPAFTFTPPVIDEASDDAVDAPDETTDPESQETL